ncbi:MAG: PEP-CTERM sorting domain-containing protein [Phycisphaera sp.]|nr:PEP-CTERM sorting domain-containing protein [Phycisphaera sp.]
MNQRTVRFSLLAMLLCAALAPAARAELILNADLNPSQIGPLTGNGSGIVIPLSNFTLSGTESVISVRFTHNQAVHIVVPNGSGSDFYITLLGVTDGAGDDTLHGPGAFYLTDAQHQALPNTTGEVGYGDRVLHDTTPYLEIGGVLATTGGTVYEFSDIHLTGSQPFDTANITGAILEISTRSDTGDGGPPVAVYGPVTIVTVPEPASVAMLALGALVLTRRCRTA